MQDAHNENAVRFNREKDHMPLTRIPKIGLRAPCQSPSKARIVCHAAQTSVETGFVCLSASKAEPLDREAENVCEIQVSAL